jgi:hypothetical protein
MKQTDSLPFKKQQKYVLERKVDGEKTYFWKEDGEYFFEPEADVDGRVASVICEKDFLLEGWVTDGSLYVTDVLYFDGESLKDETWDTRYRVLKNEFRWNSAAKLNRPLVVTDKDEMHEAVELFNMLEHSEGVVIRDYNSVYEDEKVLVREGGL